MAEWESCNAASLDVVELKIAGDCDDGDKGFNGFEAVDGWESMRA